jgi:putative membrane protein insertion efficiency factor
VRRFALGVLLIAIVIALHDFSVPTRNAIGANAAILAIDEYRSHISAHLRGIVVCRFKPTCSAYGRESIRKHGLLIGGAKTIVRIAKCGPWTKLGTVDNP